MDRIKNIKNEIDSLLHKSALYNLFLVRLIYFPKFDTALNNMTPKYNLIYKQTF